MLSSFVRNRLIDEVYLPLIGANLAKQLGAAGEDKRTDQMGMLLLDLAARLRQDDADGVRREPARPRLREGQRPGARATTVTSLDPAEAPNATARQEVEKINLALEMGNNVMLYLDDIQHT